MMEQPPGPVHNFIRNVYDEIRFRSNYHSAIRAISIGLAQARDKESDNSALQGNPLCRSSVDQMGCMPECRNNNNNNTSDNNNVSEGTTSDQVGGLTMDGALAAQGVRQVAQDNAKKGGTTTTRLIFNRSQKYRLLLLRADAYSATKQHEKALEDAKAALQLSYNCSAEAYFIIGRELLRLSSVEESVKAFEKAESLLATGESFFVQKVSDENFWAQRGFCLADVERLKLSRREMEQEEHATRAASLERCNGAQCASALPCTPFSATSEVAASWSNAQLLSWRQLAKEARAFLTLHTLHILPVGVLRTPLLLLDRRMSSVRGGVVACVENTTSRAFRLVGCASPDAIYSGGMRFPNSIPPGHCALALFQPRRWGGFVTSVCYEVEENGACCYFCFACSFMGSIKCGVRFVLQGQSLGLAHVLKESNNSDNDGTSGTGPDGAPSREFVDAKILNPSLWFSAHIVPLSSGCKLKALGEIRGNSRTVMFSVTEILSIRLRSVELLTALEFAGPAVLKKMSAVSRRYRELINNFPPQMFCGAGRGSYPDYCLPSDHRSSPWIVHDKERVRWNFLFDGHLVNRENYLVTDSADSQSGILFFSGEGGGSLEAAVYHGDKRSCIALIKGSWVPFSNTFYFCTPSGRTFASCFTNRNSQLTMAWDSAGRKSKMEDVEYVMYRKSPMRQDGGPGRSPNSPNVFFAGGVHDTDTSDSVLTSSANESVPGSSFLSSPRGRRGLAFETYSVFRPQRTSGGCVAGGTPTQTNCGMELVAEFTVSAPPTERPEKGAKIGELLLHTGVDALLVTLMAYCRLKWET